IEYLGTEELTDAPPKSFPAKLTALLYTRFRVGLPGFVILSCELIDNNGKELLACVLRYAELWRLPEEFIAWVKSENDFCNTLVDRICTGYPKDDAESFAKRIGTEDRLMNTAEIFHLWVIEGHHEDIFPLQKAGINVIWTDDVKPYKKRKVRILNGGHTSMVLGARLYGLSTVKECLDDPVVSRFLRKAMFEEIIPTLGHEQEDIPFGNAVLERFANPFVKHQLLSIALNSVSKWKARVLPTILEYREQRGSLPQCLTWSLAALIEFYRTDEANDGEEIMAFMKTAPVREILAKKEYWGQDITFLAETVERYCDIMERDGMAAAYEAVLGER
ncbi:MAG: tagaturonate reductase, partial [Lachnospiraceae bacterium]|nr:tagaturonate reductase [Lachnospiraceae bacterium]